MQLQQQRRELNSQLSRLDQPIQPPSRFDGVHANSVSRRAASSLRIEMAHSGQVKTFFLGRPCFERSTTCGCPLEQTATAKDVREGGFTYSDFMRFPLHLWLAIRLAGLLRVWHGRTFCSAENDFLETSHKRALKRKPLDKNTLGKQDTIRGSLLQEKATSFRGVAARSPTDRDYSVFLSNGSEHKSSGCHWRRRRLSDHRLAQLLRGLAQQPMCL